MDPAQLHEKGPRIGRFIRHDCINLPTDFHVETTFVSLSLSLSLLSLSLSLSLSFFLSRICQVEKDLFRAFGWIVTSIAASDQSDKSEWRNR